MIIVTISVLAFVVLSLLINFLYTFPILDHTVVEAVMLVLPYIRRGVTFFNDFCYPVVVWTALGGTLALRVAYVSYRVTMWIIKKIPLLSIED